MDLPAASQDRKTPRQKAIEWVAEKAARMRTREGDGRPLRQIILAILGSGATPAPVMAAADHAERSSRAWKRFLADAENEAKRVAGWLSA